MSVSKQCVGGDDRPREIMIFSAFLNHLFLLWSCWKFKHVSVTDWWTASGAFKGGRERKAAKMWRKPKKCHGLTLKVNELCYRWLNLNLWQYFVKLRVLPPRWMSEKVGSRVKIEVWKPPFPTPLQNTYICFNHANVWTVYRERTHRRPWVQKEEGGSVFRLQCS